MPVVHSPVTSVSHSDRRPRLPPDLPPSAKCHCPRIELRLKRKPKVVGSFPRKGAALVLRRVRASPAPPPPVIRSENASWPRTTSTAIGDAGIPAGAWAIRGGGALGAGGPDSWTTLRPRPASAGQRIVVRHLRKSQRRRSRRRWVASRYATIRALDSRDRLPGQTLKVPGCRMRPGPVPLAPAKMPASAGGRRSRPTPWNSPPQIQSRHAQGGGQRALGAGPPIREGVMSSPRPAATARH